MEIYALLNRHQFVANARWFGDVFGVLWTMPPDTVAAAKACGEARTCGRRRGICWRSTHDFDAKTFPGYHCRTLCQEFVDAFTVLVR